MLNLNKIVVLGVCAITAIFVFDIASNKEQIDNLPYLTSERGVIEWKRYTAKDFSILLPALAQHAAEAVPLPNNQGAIKYDMYLTQQKNGANFMISSIKYPESFDTSTPGSLLEDVIKELLTASPSNKLKKKVSGNFQNNQSLDFEIENDVFFIQGRTFLSKKTLYVLTFIDKKNRANQQTFKTFSDSFKFESSGG